MSQLEEKNLVKCTKHAKSVHVECMQEALPSSDTINNACIRGLHKKYLTQSTNGA